MNLEIIVLSQRKRQIPHNITYMWNLKYNTNEEIYLTETDPLTDVEKRLAGAKGRLKVGE